MWPCVTVFPRKTFVQEHSLPLVLLALVHRFRSTPVAGSIHHVQVFEESSLVGSFSLRIFVNSRSGHRLSSVKIKETVMSQEGS